MSILNIQDARREGARLLIMLCGVSGGGKTKTALEIASGMVGGNMAKVGFLDTENGRGKLYADDYPKPYRYAELRPPFSPARYVQAIEEFAQEKVEVLIIDSGSHEYEGTGGVIDIAEAGNPRMPNWNKGKGEHKKYRGTLLNSPFHIILCLRAREKAKPEKQVINGQEKMVYVDMGLQPIAEKNDVFEATVSLMINDQGLRQDVIKCPAALTTIMGRGSGYITPDDGQALRAWVDGAKQLDPKVEHSRGLLKLAAEKGMEALKAQWSALPKAHQKAIGGSTGCPADLKASAEAFDRQAQEAGEGEQSPGLAALNAAAAEVAAQPEPEPAKAAPSNTTGVEAAPEVTAADPAGEDPLF